MSRLASAVTAFVVFVASTSLGQASDETVYRTQYRVTLAGIPIANASFVTEMTRQRYAISGTFSSAGIVDLLTSISAETNVSGRLRGGGLEATHYSLVYRKGKKVKVYDVQMRGGNVTHSEIKPPPKKYPENWVPVTASDLKSVLDPLTGLIVSDDSKVCRRTLPIFDGESRMDLVLSPNGKQKFSLGDTKVDAVVCSIRYVPKSGFKKGREDVEYLSKVSGMEIWFAKTNGMDLYAPVHARIPTRYGPVYITAVDTGK